MATASRPHVLVLDDDPVIHEALTAALADRYTVYAAATGAEACAILRTHPIAAIILDAILGKEHGLDLVDALQAIAPVPIVLLTVRNTEDLAIRAVGKMARCPKKPVSLPNLHATLDGLLGPRGWFTHPATQARRQLDAHLATPAPDHAVVSALHLCERHVRRLFRARHGRTQRQYVAVARLERIEELLWTAAFGECQSVGACPKRHTYTQDLGRLH